MKVGVLTGSISRQAGGFFWSVRSLASWLQKGACEVQIFSVHDRFSNEDAAKWMDLDLHLLTPRGPESFGYAPGYGAALDASELDVVHTHGLWMFPSLVAWRWSKRWQRPLVVSPRGMLDPWAIRNSAWKKWIVGLLFQRAHLRHVHCVHVLCESEYQSVRRYGMTNPVAIIPNGVELPDLKQLQSQPAWAVNLPTNSRVLLFLGRIHPKKGLKNFLHAWASARQHATTAAEPWHLVIAGWDQGGHQGVLQQLAASLGLEQSVHFIGPQFDEQKAASLAHANAFVLPSFSEGLPMAVLEAWSYNLPVLMTEACNLVEGFQSGAAARLPLGPADMAPALANFLDMEIESLRDMGIKGRALVERRFTWERVGREMLEVYRWLADGASMPDTVTTR